MQREGVIGPRVFEFVAAIGAERNFEIEFFGSVGEGAEFGIPVWK